jgi:hypothetical protein
VIQGRPLRAAGRFVFFRPDLIPKQIHAQSEQKCTHGDERHQLRNISHIEIPPPARI